MLRALLRLAEAYEEKEHPLAFSERILRQCVDHAFGVEKARTDKDLKLMRLVFRREGGSWEKLMRGDQKQLKLLGDIVVAWGKNSK